jgi:starch phosphorylase
MSVTEQDAYDLNKIYDILENEIIPTYYNDRDTWRQICKNGMRDVRFRFDAGRMADEYYQLLYK